MYRHTTQIERRIFMHIFLKKISKQAACILLIGLFVTLLLSLFILATVASDFPHLTLTEIRQSIDMTEYVYICLNITLIGAFLADIAVRKR